MMRILHCVKSIRPESGGPAEFLRQLSMVNSEDHMEIVSLDPPGTESRQAFACPVHILGSGVGNYGLNLQLIKWLRMNARNFDIVVIHGLWQFNSFGTLLAIKDSNVPYVVMPHGMLDPWFRDKYPLKHLKKAIYWKAAEHHTFNQARAIIFTTAEERDLAHNAFKPYNCKSAITGLGIADCASQLDGGWKEFSSKYPMLQKQEYILFLGRLHEKKGCDMLIEAFVQQNPSPSQHLVVAGPGSEQMLATLRGKAAGSTQVIFTGMLNGHLKWGALAGAAAFALPSHQENFGISVVEALSAGTPVLVSDKVNIHKTISAEEAGFVESDSLSGTIRLLERFAALPLESKLAMRQKARACFLNHFEISKAYQTFREILRDCSGVAQRV